MRKHAIVAIALCGIALANAAAWANASPAIGTPPTPAQIKAWNDDIAPGGSNLPAGSGSVAQGEHVYATRCAACHGASGQGGPMDKLVGGQGTLGTAKPVKTIGSYWPYATTVFDYVRRAMPFDRPGSLTSDDVYAVTAYLLHLNDIVPAGATMNAATLPRVHMPNHDAFIEKDPRPDAP